MTNMEMFGGPIKGITMQLKSHSQAEKYEYTVHYVKFLLIVNGWYYFIQVEKNGNLLALIKLLPTVECISPRKCLSLLGREIGTSVHRS